MYIKFYYQRAHFDYLNFIYNTKMQKKSNVFMFLLFPL